MKIVEWFKPSAAAREKERHAAANLAEVEARINRLNEEAGDLYVSGPGNERRLGAIEAELRDLMPRRGWLQRARDRMAAQAAAEEAAAEAERKAREEEARQRRIAELSERYLGDVVTRIASTRRAHLEALDEAAAMAGELAAAIDTAEARRRLGPRAIAYRYRATGWRDTHGWYPYSMGIVPEVRRDLLDLEGEIVAELRRPAAEGVAAPDDPAAVSPAAAPEAA